MNDDMPKEFVTHVANLARKNVDEAIDVITRDLVKYDLIGQMPLNGLRDLFVILFKAYRHAFESDWEDRLKIADNANENISDEEMVKIMKRPEVQKWMKEMGMDL